MKYSFIHDFFQFLVIDEIGNNFDLFTFLFFLYEFIALSHTF